jgi:uncharacterized membrane protein YeaQ/YmgE (transglycosylase-associated protein family)
VPVVLIVLAALVVVFVVGWIVVGLVLKLLWWALVGVAIGAIARAILPGKQEISLLATAGSGIGAALLGGIIAHIVGVGAFVQFLIALLVAVVIVAVVSTSARPRRA